MLATKVHRVHGTVIRWALDFVDCVLASAWLGLQQSRNLVACLLAAPCTKLAYSQVPKSAKSRTTLKIVFQKLLVNDGELAWDPKAVLARVGKRTYARPCVRCELGANGKVIKRSRADAGR